MSMRSIGIAGLFILIGTAAQADIVCTAHGGCWETGKMIIYGDGGGTRYFQCVNTERYGKTRRVCFKGGQDSYLTGRR